MSGSPATTRSQPIAQSRPTGWRRLAFPLLAILAGIAPFFVLEGTLVVLGVGDPCGDDALVGFGSASPLFELEEDGSLYSTARSRQLFFGRQQFAPEKPERTYRIFGLGGSTVRGRPYEADTSFLKWLEIELNGRDSSRQYETVNCGGLSYASYRLTYILDEVLHYDPDLIVIATGHNEFLEDRSYESLKNRASWVNWTMEKGAGLRTVALARRIYRENGGDPDTDQARLDPEVEARLDEASGYGSYRRDDRWRQNVIREYEWSLRRLIAACRRASVPLILVNLGENLRECPPFKSEHKPGLSAESLQKWQTLFDGAARQETTDLDQSLRTYQEAEAIDGEYALLAFRIARVLDRLGRFEYARDYYVRAKELDICPLRMIEPLHERLKGVAAETGTPLVDAERLAVEISPQGIPGNNCFMDHVHPNIACHQMIGQMLADRMASLELFEPKGGWNEGQRRAAYRRYFHRLGSAYLANGRRRVGWEENWARRERLDSEALPKDARGHLHLGQKRLDWGDLGAAWEQFAFALTLEPQRSVDVLTHGLSLHQQGRSRLAEELLVLLQAEPSAADLRPATRLAHLIVLLDTGEVEKAADVYARSGDEIDRLVGAPDSASAPWKSWLDVMPEVRGRIESDLRPAAVAAAPADENRPVVPSDGSSKYGRSEVKAFSSAPSRERDAGEDFEAGEADRQAAVILALGEAIRRNPSSAPLHLTRARIHFARQHYQQALADASRAIEIEPGDADACKFRSIIQMILGNADEARADLDRAIALDPESTELLRLRAAAHRRLGDEEKTQADLHEAQRLDGQ